MNHYDLPPLDIDRELNALLQSLQRPHTHEGSLILDMDDTISLEIYKKLFNKTRENTSSSPSKIHMGHYIASCEHDNIANVHRTMMYLPFHYGFTLDRWLNSLHCMLLKMINHTLTNYA